MKFPLRYLLPLFLLGLSAIALATVFQFSDLPPADFTFANGTEVKSVDPKMVTGAPEGRVIEALFEGLYQRLPSEEDPTVLVAAPGQATSYELSEDKLTYTFHIREDSVWSNGEPVTAHDWVFSWQRFLHPQLPSEYAYQLWYVKNAEKYSLSKVEVGDRVEIELPDRAGPKMFPATDGNSEQHFPRGTILSGILKKVTAVAGDEGKIFEVEVKPTKDGKIAWDAPGEIKKFVKLSESDAIRNQILKDDPKVQPVNFLTIHFDEVGIKAPDDHTLVVTLTNPTPYFLDLVAFYPMHPVNRTCIETYGYPEWTKPENIVSNGAFTLEFRRIRDRIRLRKNPKYWDAENVKLNIIDVLAVQSDTTVLNMYMNGQIDWGITVPTPALPSLLKRDAEKPEGSQSDMRIAPMLTTYFYRINTTRPGLDNPKVRRALNLAINKQEIVDYVTKAGQIPATSYVPPGLAGYGGGHTGEYDPEEARRLLAEAGYPGGKGLPKVQILYNTHEGHKDIASVVQQQLKKNLQIDVELRNLEWSVFLASSRNLEYDIARAGWIADYPDPNTFLDMFVTGGENNQTGWSNAEYDQLIRDAQAEADPVKRLEMLSKAEQILMDEMPILPIYYYVSLNIVRPYVKNFYPNIQDLHPLHILEIDEAEKARIFEAEGLR
ncbi:peptide ABC transporter substrate-binding protein [Blastopirellula sp. JC732]|uniref:Peptide ABC transporter substrate-binding protein n=1 Tax=Blastopirellula sediminis TaxID=2894196 RepID=A0A9X1MJY8_9BACT|nr:peptide ABC transporter substrate-binding protein [Blastopirellula sediminis]MCC9609639.1 peptide ABC transporter substrate-binding protein [Blastopirellula sediminis]MCC9627585.1 peptide ABC transporter substrate-binding protein [Blastopirellula sediminis]